MPWIAEGLLLAVLAAVSKRKLGVKAMTKRNKAILIVLPLLVLAGIAMLMSCSNQETFTGSRVKNPDAYLQKNRKSNAPSDRYMGPCASSAEQLSAWAFCCWSEF